MSKPFLISIDQGTTGSRVFCYDLNGAVLSSAYREFTQYFPAAGWVEHNAAEIWNGIELLLKEAMRQSNLDAKNCRGIGITNQRETVLLWNKKTGQPLHHAIVWQCRRTKERCDELKSKGLEKIFRHKTGLLLDAYFSGTKIEWLLTHTEDVKNFIANDEIAAGTIDSYLLFCLTGKKIHATDITNASRTLLFNIHTHKWDDELASILNIPLSILPQVYPSRYRFGVTKNVSSLPDGIPILAMAGDQQAALFGQLAVHKGEAKNTYGTGCFLLFNTGDHPVESQHGLITTIACNEKGKPCYALEGSVFIGGAVIQWLRDYMKFFANASESEELIASSMNLEEKLVFVPAFTGLGAPYWDMSARGAIFGITRDTTPADITRAAIKSIALQSSDVVFAMEQDTGEKLSILRVDGGACKNSMLMQYQSDILSRPVEVPKNIDTTAIGVMYLAGLEAGVWNSVSEIQANLKEYKRYTPKMSENKRENELNLWKSATRRVMQWP